MRQRIFTGDAYVPFSNQFFVVTIGVSGVPEGASGFVNGIQNLQYSVQTAGSASWDDHRAYGLTTFKRSSSVPTEP